VKLTYLIDTDWAVWWLRDRPEVGAKLRDREQEGLAISAVTLAELWEGVEGSADPLRARTALEGFLRLVHVLPFSDEVARLFGKEAVRLGKLGQTIPDFDLVIAATALHHDLILMSEDRTHFSRIPGLKLESLASPG
jgi:tRNA(fMet)-specific endonuclease VapC